MTKPTLLASAAALFALAHSSSALACGGFFCGRLPVDQTAERIFFEVGGDSVTMTTQIAFNGDAADFAWILPLPEVPDEESLSVFPQAAMTGLDANSGPVFLQPNDAACYPAILEVADAACANCGGAAPTTNAEEPQVTVHIQAEVDAYEVAVVESEDSAALITWLREHSYRVTPPMEPYIDLYTQEGMKFLALRLLETADVESLKPFRFTLPGTSPTIPLRMTALAAEPEMSLLVFVFGERRYEGKNWENLAIADDQIRYNPFSYSWPLQTNWAKLVAEAVDEAGGQGWVTEFAGSTASYLDQVQLQIEQGTFADPSQEEAAVALRDVLQAHPYVTRLYSRLSAEEMTSDPVFGQSSDGDVAQEHQLERYVNGEDQCSPERMMQPSVEPCDYATCGAGGLCVPVAAEDALSSSSATGTVNATSDVAGCACVPGATARTTFAPDGTPTVICQDEHMSFLNPGDQEMPGLEALPDPCATFDCGDSGSCVPMNMTPTCVCDEGFVATGSIDASGQRVTTCVAPAEPVPVSFYQRRLPALPASLPGGREVDGAPSPGDSDPVVVDPVTGDPTTGDPAGGGASGGCTIAATDAPGRARGGLVLSLGIAGLWLMRRRRTA